MNHGIRTVQMGGEVGHGVVGHRDRPVGIGLPTEYDDVGASVAEGADESTADGSGTSSDNDSHQARGPIV